MSPQRTAEVAAVCLSKVPGIHSDRAKEVASIVSRGYLKMIQESDEWRNATGILRSFDSLEHLLKVLLGKDEMRVIGGLTADEKKYLGYLVLSSDEEQCFIWAWRAFCLYGRQFHSSHVIPKELQTA